MKRISFFVLSVFLCGCGSGTTTSTSVATTRGVTAAALSATSSSAASGAGNISGLVVQALTLTQPEVLKEAVTQIPDKTSTTKLSCKSGGGTTSSTIGGTVTTESSKITDIMINLTNTVTYNDCTPNDIATTTDVNESDYTIAGSLNGTGTFTGTQTAFAFEVTETGTLTVSGKCTGSLAFNNFKVSGSGNISNNTDSLSCTPTGSITGTVCSMSVTCTLGGTCDNPTLSGANCT